MSEDKELPPSDQKLQKALDENQDEQSDEINGLVTTFTIGAMAYMLLPGVVTTAEALLRMDGMDARRLDNVRGVINELFDRIAGLAEHGAFVLLGAALVSGFLGNLLNRRRPPSFKGPSFSYDPLSKAAGMFKVSLLLTTLKTWVLALLIVGLFAWRGSGLLPITVNAIYASPLQAIATAWQISSGLLPLTVGIVILSALVDAVQKHMSFISSNKMDEEEVKKENKEDNGDPAIKSKRMEIMRGG
jgi:flagellar biosynthesis protein FlhB